MSTSARVLRPMPAVEVDPYDVSAYPRPAEWTERAACEGLDTNLFFSDRDLALNAAAKRVCAACPVQLKCLEAAIASGEEYGIRGGVNFANSDERRRLRSGGAPSNMAHPVRCSCGELYDLAAVTVTARYDDCSVWTLPCCGKTADDRPRFPGEPRSQSATGGAA